MNPLLEKLRAVLPNELSRKDIAKYFKKWISSKYLANLDSKKEGPKAYRVGERKIIYDTDDFLNWLDKRITPLDPDAE